MPVLKSLASTSHPASPSPQQCIAALLILFCKCTPMTKAIPVPVTACDNLKKKKKSQNANCSIVNNLISYSDGASRLMG